MVKKIFTPIVISLALSLVLHAAFIGLVSGTGVFDFVRSFTNKPLTALLISGNTGKPPFAFKRRSSQSASAKNKPSVQSDDPVTRKSGPASQEKEDTAQDSLSGAATQKVTDGDLPVNTATEGSGPHAPEAVDAGGKAENGPAPDQAAAVPIMAQPALNPENRAVLLKSAREKLSYKIYCFGIYVGRAELEAVSSEGKVTIKSQVHSAPVISVIYTVDDYSESNVVDGLPVKFRIKQHEGKYRSDKETIFDLDNKHVTFVNNLKGTKDDFTVKGGGLWDLISGFYYLRTQAFEVGKTIYIAIFDSKKFFTAEVNVIGKERIKSSKNEDVDTVKVKPRLQSEGLFQNKGEILIWLTDDENKTPVRIETKVPIGTVVAELTSVETE